MDTEKCKILLDVLENGSLSVTADKLGYTTSGISRTIEAMEKQAGFTMMNRKRNKIALTEEGKTLLPIIRELAYWGDQYDQIVGKLRGLDTGHIRLGAAYACFYPWLSKMIVEFHKKYPNITVELTYGTSSELSTMMDERRLDYGLITKRNGNHRWRSLFMDDIIVMLNKNFKLENNRVSRELLKKEPFIEINPYQDNDVKRFLEEAGITPRVTFSTTDGIAGCSMVEAGLGLGMTNSLIARYMAADIKYAQLDPPYAVDIGIIYPDEETISPAAQCFIDFVEPYVGELEMFEQHEGL